ncbi:hypothetical protein PSTT_07363 [Puccinia striiformis]|uniref:mRNA 3'-end-processing protein RNA14 n=1 Tax=Puccinia striiformis TaxID=27350 RepID=A0A2S4VGG4_9BASI|nr:hypothetical protein PSTT_07363 [Puccinia striiformis]
MDNSLRDPRLFSTNNSLRDPALLSYPELISPTILSSSSATENYNIISNEQLHRDIQALHNLEIEKLNTQIQPLKKKNCQNNNRRKSSIQGGILTPRAWKSRSSSGSRNGHKPEEEVEILTNQEEEVEILTNHEEEVEKTIPPLFAPSPSQSENQQQTSDHENLNNSNVRSSSSSPILADNLQEQQQNQQPQQPQQPVLSRLASLRQRVEKDPMDGEAWIELINDSVKKGDLEKTREVYESFLKYFPDAANQWISYADLELGHGHFPEVEQIFSRCLRSSVSVELWAFYLNYIRRLNHIGIDRESGQIWLDYINIVKAGEAAGTWQEQQKMDSLRKLYQRAVCIPLDNIEQVWKEYDGFEHQMSKMTAKKFLADKSAQYMMARASLKEMKSLTDPLLRPRVPVKPNWKRINDHKQLDQWKTYLAWEEKNPLEITDKNLLNTRIQYAYRQAIMHMRFYPEIWYLAASHLQKNEKAEEALAVLQSGLTANPTSIVLTYATVEAQEDMKNYAACYEAFNSLIQYYHTEIDEINKTIEKEIAHGIPIIDSKTVANPTLPSTTQVDGETDQQELTEEEKVRAKEEEQLRSNITALYKPKIDEFREAAASVWITEMRFARRTEGIKPARAVFTRARKAQYITSHVFEASAMMEYHWNKEPAVATKVFDLGLKTFSEDVNYVLQYLNFLITLNDDSNARALFEKTISKINPESARPLWRRWAAYEFIYGDKAASEKLNLRVAEIFPDWGVVERLSDRHAYADLGEVIGRELGTCIEPIPLRNRSPSPVPQHLEGYGFKRAGGGGGGMHEHPGGIPSGPASYRNRQHHQHSNQRDRSFSPDVRGKRARGQRSSISPDRRNGPTSTTIGPNNPSNLSGDSGNANKRGRENYENNPKRNRYSSPPNRNNHNNNRAHTPPLDSNSNQNHVANNPYSWFPEGLRYFLSILPLSTSFEGPRLDTSTVLQVLSEVTMPVGNNGGVNNVSNIPHGPSNSSNTSTGRGGGGGVPSGPASRGGNGNGSDNYNNHGNHVIAGWGPNRGGGNNSGSSGRGSHNPTRRGRRK